MRPCMCWADHVFWFSAQSNVGINGYTLSILSANPTEGTSLLIIVLPQKTAISVIAYFLQNISLRWQNFSLCCGIWLGWKIKYVVYVFQARSHLQKKALDLILRETRILIASLLFQEIQCFWIEPQNYISSKLVVSNLLYSKPNNPI